MLTFQVGVSPYEHVVRRTYLSQAEPDEKYTEYTHLRYHITKTPIILHRRKAQST